MTQLLTPRVHTRQALNLRTQLHRQRIIPPRTRGKFRLTAFRRQRTVRGGIQRNGDFGLREERTVSVLRRQMYQRPHKRCRSQSTSAICMCHQAQLKQRLGKSKVCIAIWTTHPLGDLVFRRLELGDGVADLANPDSQHHDEHTSLEKQLSRTAAGGGSNTVLTSHSMPNSLGRLAL